MSRAVEAHAAIKKSRAVIPAASAKKGWTRRRPAEALRRLAARSARRQTAILLTVVRAVRKLVLMPTRQPLMKRSPLSVADRA